MPPPRIDDILTPCAQLYARARVDPFNTPAGACVPDQNTNVSKRLKVTYRGTMTVGAGGFGYIAVNPNSFFYNTINTSVVSSGPTYAGTVIEADTTVVGVQGGLSDSPYSDSSGDFQNYRVVAGGIRWAYKGTELLKGGSCVALLHPKNMSLDQAPFTGLALFRETRVCTAGNRKWDSVLWSPVGTAQYSYTEGLGGATATDAGNIPLGVAVSGAPPGANGNVEYSVEIVFHYEVIGELVTDKQPSQADSIGLDAVNEVLKAAPYTGGAPEDQRKPRTMLAQVAHTVLHGISGVGRWIVKNKAELASIGASAAAILL